MQGRRRQRGASLILAVFLITSLAALGVLATRAVVLSTEATDAGWYAAQALYAAEAGVDYAAHVIVTGSPPSAQLREVVAGRAWFRIVEVNSTAVDGAQLWTIVSIGLAGPDPNAPLAQRRVETVFMP